MTRANKHAHISHEGYVVLLAFIAGLPGSVMALYLLWADGHTLQFKLTITTLVVCVWLGCAFAVRERVVFPLQTLSNLLGALREGDYSVRGRSPKPDVGGFSPSKCRVRLPTGRHCTTPWNLRGAATR